MTRKSEFISAFDSYNLCLTGDIGRTLATPSGGLNEHIPVILGCDLYNFAITGDVACNMNANSNASANHAGPTVLVLNDQGGSIMQVSDIACTLRAQMKHHEPIVCLNFQGSKSNNVITEDGKCYSLNAMHGHDVHVVCFEPGILSRDCSAGNRAYMDICSTLRAQMGDNQPAICYEQVKEDKVYALDHVITTGANCTAQGPCVYEDICPTEKAGGVHAVCYAIDSHPGDSRIGIAGEVSPTLTVKIAKASADGPLVMMKHE